MALASSNTGRRLAAQAGCLLLAAGSLILRAETPPRPENLPIAVPFKVQDGRVQAVVDIPARAHRFALAIKVHQSLPSEASMRVLDKRGAPQVPAATVVSQNGSFALPKQRGDLMITPYFVTPNERVVTATAINVAPAQAEALEVVGLVLVVSNSTPQGYVEDGSTGFCDGVNEDKRPFAESVARLSITSGKRLGYCTGFAVGPRHLLTNHHCIADLPPNQECGRIGMEFNYTCPSRRTDIHQPRCIKIAHRNETLDYALIEFEPLPGNKIPPLQPADLPTGQPREIYLLHHNAGVPLRVGTTAESIGQVDLSEENRKKISMTRAECSGIFANLDNEFLSVTAADVKPVITHWINTVGGASGAPLMVDNKVVGLHFDRDRRYYRQGCMDVGMDNCLTTRHPLPNWAMKICDVLRDIPAGITGIKRCPP